MSNSGAERYHGKSYVGTTLDPTCGPPIREMRWLASYGDVQEVLRSRDFEQGGGGRRDSAPFIGDGMLSLSGDEHFQRRRLVSSLFRRPTLKRLEEEIFAPSFAASLGRCERMDKRRRRGDLQKIIRSALCKVSAALVGIEGIDGDEVIGHYLECMEKLAVGVNIEWMERDHREVTLEVLSVKKRFAQEFFAPSWSRWAAFVAEYRAGKRSHDELPNNLITVIQLNADHFARWDEDVALREVILVNGAPASIPLAISHVLQELLAWLSAQPERQALTGDREFLRQAVLESLRLHPASPFLIRRAVTDVRLKSGYEAAAGDYVVLDLLTASRDPSVYSDPDCFDPQRATNATARPGGLTFGSGPHTCIGMAMSIGDPSATADGAQGIMLLILREMFRRSVALDPEKPPRWNDTNVRNEYAEFPVCFLDP
jgi:cytochrome P450